MYVLDDIIEFIKEQTAIKDVNPEDDLLNDLGCSGDDHHEFMAEYARKYKVDMNSYLWYFHADEEGQNIGGTFFKPPYERIKHISITPLILLESANKGKWALNYPEHKLPKHRYDIFINQVLVSLLIAYIIYSCFRK
jgi:hypothetical protein